MIEWFSVLVMVFVVNVVWAFYVQSVNKNEALLSSIWATFLFGASGVATISWVANPWLLIPACIGAFSGTYVAVEMHKAGMDRAWFKTVMHRFFRR